MNNCTFTGRLTRDPELRYTSQNFPVCKFDIAIDRKVQERVTDYIHIKTLGKTAENCARYLSKGRLVGINGELHTESYEKDGVKHSTWEVVAFNVEFLESKKEAAHEQTPAVSQNSWQMPIDDIPF